MVCAYISGEEQMRKIFRQNQGATKFDLHDAIKLDHDKLDQILSRVVTERENRTWSWRSACGVAVIDLDYAKLQEENCRRIDEYRFTYFIYKHMKI